MAGKHVERRWHEDIHAAAKARRWKDACQLLSEMQRLGIQPGVKAYTATVSACAKCGQQTKALHLLAEMQAQGIQPNVITYTAAISACEKSKDQWQTALKLLAEMQAQGIQPNVITYPAAISACEKPEVHGQGAEHVGAWGLADLTMASAYVAPKSKQGRNKIRFK